MRRRLDSAQFWVALGAAVIALGFVLIAVSSIGLSPGEKPEEPWFVVGAVALGVLLRNVCAGGDNRWEIVR
jgi:hypothetical protein